MAPETLIPERIPPFPEAVKRQSLHAGVPRRVPCSCSLVGAHPVYSTMNTPRADVTARHLYYGFLVGRRERGTSSSPLVFGLYKTSRSSLPRRHRYPLPPVHVTARAQVVVHELSHLRHILCLSAFLLLTSYPACDGGRALDYYGAVQPSEGSPEPSEEVGSIVLRESTASARAGAAPVG
jgi:hypothetical protein